jgi:sporulation protein YlmC with PRC-barrel domain
MTTTDNTSLDVISSDKVEGTSVYNPAGEKLGSIDDLMIDKRTGQIRYAVLEFGGFLGMGTDRYPVPWKVLKYSPEQGGYVVPLTKDALKNAPKYQHSAIPPYDTAYGATIDRYYSNY